MHAKLRRLQAERRQEIGLVVVDYLQLMSGRGRFEIAIRRSAPFRAASSCCRRS